jgi:hypothetical protein
VKKRFNGESFDVTEHAELRYLQRITHERQLNAQDLEEAEPYTLQDYAQGFVNQNEGIVFLTRDDSITTIIPAKGLEFCEDDPECGNCGARVQSSCRKPWECGFCGQRVREEVDSTVESRM